jgi:hypothetical protein
MVSNKEVTAADQHELLLYRTPLLLSSKTTRRLFLLRLTLCESTTCLGRRILSLGPAGDKEANTGDQQRVGGQHGGAFQQDDW